MSDLLARLRAMSPSTQVWTLRDGPRNSPDLQRVLALPRRQAVPAQELADKWTQKLKRPEGTMWLRAIQGLALEEAWLYRALFGLIGVGWGKTLISLLLPVVWGSKRPGLLLPPKLRKKLFELEYPALSKHWRLPPLIAVDPRTKNKDNREGIYVVSYSQLSTVDGTDLLERLELDDLICDEAHCLRHPTAARTKRFRRFARTPRPYPAEAYPEGNDLRGGEGLGRRRIAGLSGTATSGSITDYAHLCQLILGNGSPLPLEWNALQEWSLALDPVPDGIATPAGALERLCDPGESLRSGFRRRLIETPGVVATTDNNPGASLVFDRRPLKAPKVVLDALEKARDGERPDGEILKEAVEVYALTRQLSCGFWYQPTYPRGESKEAIRAWMDARRDYNSEVNDRLSLGRVGQDSPELLRRAAESGQWKSQHYARWKALKNTVRPVRKTVWLSTFLVEAAVKWAHESPGLIWVESEAVKAAFAIAKDAGIPVYAKKEDAPALWAEDGSRSVVVAANVFGTGENLQHAFHRNLITTIPPGLEQVIGRTHRPGQPADEVTVDFFLHTPESVRSFKAAQADAKYAQETLGNAQKLCIGSYLFAL